MRYNLELIEYNGLPVLASPKILRERSIHIFITTRLGGTSREAYGSLNLAYHVGDDPANVAENRRRALTAMGLDPARLKTVGQVHGNKIVKIDQRYSRDDGEKEADALTTTLTETPLAVFTADCVPVILADTERRKITVVHAGWKGIYSLIVPRALAGFKSTAHSGTRNLYAFIGPAVGPCCYEVDRDRAGLFNEKYVTSEDRRISLNLPAIVRDQLLEAGMDIDNIADSGLCTCCRKDLFFSFRRDGICGRQMASAALMKV